MNDNVISRLEGEEPIPGVTQTKDKGSNAKRLVVVAIMLVTLVGGVVFAVSRFVGKATNLPDKTISSPDVASAQSNSLKMPEAPVTPGPGAASGASLSPTAAASAGQAGTVVPGIEHMAGDSKAIGVSGTGGAGPATSGAPRVASPDDAPIFSSGAAPDMHAAATVAPRGTGKVAEANASLDAYQRQLTGMMENLQRLTNGATGGSAPAPALPFPTATPTTAGSQNAPSLFGSMDRSATPTVQARMLGDRSMIVPKGTLFLCGLKTRVISATSGFIGCQVTRNVFSDNGRVLLIERGSHMDGEYRVVTVRPGVTRIPVLWTRVRTPQGVTIDLDSPATGQLGESGLGGYVDNRWGDRLGAALMLSLVNDALKYAIAVQTSSGSGNTVLLPNTTDQGSKLAEKVLETTINIPPLLYQNQGGVVGVYVSRDLDFSSVYELKPL